MADSEKNIRAFLAIEPPEDILQKISGLQEKLKREISGRISWTRPQGQHLTLKFFGDISTEDVKNICSAVQKRIASEASLNLKIEKLGVFPGCPQAASALVRCYGRCGKIIRAPEKTG